MIFYYNDTNSVHITKEYSTCTHVLSLIEQMCNVHLRGGN